MQQTDLHTVLKQLEASADGLTSDEAGCSDSKRSRYRSNRTWLVKRIA